jgi:hypothetical protein
VSWKKNLNRSAGSTVSSPPRSTAHARHEATTRAGVTWQAVKDAAIACLKAQIDLVFTARLAHDAGITVTELDTAWLRTTRQQVLHPMGAGVLACSAIVQQFLRRSPRQ